MYAPVLAIIVPCFNEQEALKQSYFELSSVVQTLITKQKINAASYICFVDDGSNDETWTIISKLSNYNDVKGLKLSRNFGHQAAQLAGLSQNEADIFITIDADLQDDITKIPEMVEKYLQGFDIVYGVMKDRSADGFMKRITSQLFYKILNLFGAKSIYNHADFRLMSKKVVDVLSKQSEYNLYLRGIIPGLGFKSSFVYYSRKKRIAGHPKYTILSSLALAIDGLTSFSITPIRLITFLGFISFLIAIIMTIYSIVVYIEHKIVPGWTSLFISIYFLGGIQLLSLGILGEYLGKIYKETKHRPKYIVEQKTE